jgi:hypothetical protein
MEHASSKVSKKNQFETQTCQEEAQMAVVSSKVEHTRLKMNGGQIRTWMQTTPTNMPYTRIFEQHLQAQMQQKKMTRLPARKHEYAETQIAGNTYIIKESHEKVDNICAQLHCPDRHNVMKPHAKLHSSTQKTISSE